ncbi:MAG: hypothetical protein QOJ40_2098, partial [Verrucomicrobiota bacterium]
PAAKPCLLAVLKDRMHITPGNIGNQ